MHIHASAPTRIDLAGGTLDIWPLYLFHDGAQTLNAAISLRASCDVRSRADRRVVIISEDSNERIEVDHWSQLKDSHDLRLLGRLLHFFQAEGLEMRTRCQSPVGAGIAGSSALNIAVWLDDKLACMISEAGWDVPLYQGGKEWVLPIPAVFVVKQDGTIAARHIDPDYRQRMEIDELLRCVQCVNPD